MHPLTKDDLDHINESLKAIMEARKIIVRSELAGLDVGTQKEQMDTAEAKLKAIKAGFFPNGKA